MGIRVKIGILGCADIVRKRAIKAFQSTDNAEVVSIASRDYKKASQWARDFKIQAEKSYDALLSNKSIDAVYIPLPVSLHEKWVIKAASAGKHIICEKSLADNFKSAVKMVEVCRAKGVVLYENFMTDFHPQHERVVSLINKGEIGKPLVFRSFFGFPMLDKNNIRYDDKLSTGSLNDVGSHIVFMARKIFGEEPISVSCNLKYDKANEVDLRGILVLEFKEGKTAFGVFGHGFSYQNNYSIWGQQGILSVTRAYSISPDKKPVIDISKTKNFKEFIKKVDAPAVDQFELIFHDFCDTVLNKKRKANKIKNIYSQIVAQARVMEALRLSSEEKRMIKITEI